MPKTKLTLEQFQTINREVSLRKPRCRYCGLVLLSGEGGHLAACKDFQPRGKITRYKRLDGPPPPSRQTRFLCGAIGTDHVWVSGGEPGTVLCTNCNEKSNVPMRILMMGLK